MTARDADSAANAGHASPTPGHVWSLRWNRTTVATLLITEAFPDFVLGLPVTSDNPFGDACAFQILVHPAPDGSGGPMFAWPTRETGIGSHLLGDLVGSLSTSVEELEAAALALESRLEESPNEESVHSYGADYLEWHEAMIGEWETLCHLDWPIAGADNVYLDEARLQSSGVSLSRLAGQLGVPTASAEKYFRGLKPVPRSVATALAPATSPDSLVADSTSATREFVTHLIRPEWKADLEDLMAVRNWDESTSRDEVLGRLALAARERTSASPTDRIRSAIKVLRES